MYKTLHVWTWTLSVCHLFFIINTDFSQIKNIMHLATYCYVTLYPIFIFYVLYIKKDK